MPMDTKQANLLLQIIAVLYEKGVIVRRNLPFGQRDATFAYKPTLTEVLLDRFLHRMHIEPSYRKLALLTNPSVALH